MTYATDSAQVCAAFVDRVARDVAERINESHEIILIGNGGGQACAEHWATDLTKVDRARRYSAPLSNAALLSMAANDYGWTAAVGGIVGASVEGDLLVAFTAGGSPNILDALRRWNGRAVVVTSERARPELLPPRLPSTVLIAAVGTDSYRVAEDAWTILGHALTDLVEPL